MVMKGFTRKFKPLEILTEEQLEAIHRGTLEVLEKTGVRVEHERALKMFKENGCEVDYKRMRVSFPPGLVEECLHKCPSSFHLKARDPKNDLRIGGNTLYFSTFSGMRILDLDTWKTRPATKTENVEAIKVLDALDNLHYHSAYTPYFEVEGISPSMSIPEGVAALMRYSTKVIQANYALDCEIFNIKMAKTVGIEVNGACLASPPLTYRRDAIESAFRFVEAGFPVWVCSGVMMGASGPATIAGSTITNNAEVMTGIVLTQLIKPGTRVWAGDCAFPMEMRTGSSAFGAIESSLHQVVFSQIWRKYGIPIVSCAVGPSSSKQIDFQCGYEKAIGAMLSALSGANVLTSYGGVYGELAFHPVQAILDDEIAGMVGRFIESVDVTEETLAIDLIDEVGPIPGMYLDKEHTRKWWKKERFMPKVADRTSYPEWMEKGKKSALDHAKERMKEILATHEPTPLTSDQEAALERILEEARKYYSERGLL